MACEKRCFCTWLFLSAIVLIATEVAEGRSLTFVIDDSYTMLDDMQYIKQAVNAIITESHNTDVEDFVLVTINDPAVAHITTTTDGDKFKKAVMSLTPHGSSNNDCPEMSMSGIELALEKSRPGSLIYVITDASAKDPEKYNAVKNLAQMKSVQVSFILTGDCSNAKNAGNTEVYNQLAQATAGRVFNILHKSETNTVLDYITQQINSKKEVSTTKTVTESSM